METDQPAPEEPTDRARIIPWIASAVVLLAAIGLVAFLRACQSGDEVTKVTKTVVDTVVTTVKALPDLAAKFKTGTITTTFTDHLTTLDPRNGGVLEVATSLHQETFERRDEKRLLWDWVSLGATTSSIRAPVTYRYHIRLSDTWRLATRDHTCLVLAPAIHPSQPPALHTAELEKSTQAGWARFNGQENLDALEKSLTPELEKRAASARYLGLVRERCRQNVADFVKNWLLKEDFWREDRFSAVIVIFPDEHATYSDEELAEFRERGPSVILEKPSFSNYRDH